MDYSNRKCEYPGCVNIGYWNKINKGILYRGDLCQKHHNLKYGMKKMKGKGNQRDRLRKKGMNKKCSLCGWEGPCDIHRIINGKDGGTYNKNNIRVLCPNCHRLEHYKNRCDKV